MSPKNPPPLQPRLIIIASPSGGGKTTLCKMLLKEFPDVHLSISATTRKKRPQEVDGKDYFFLSLAEFEANKKKGNFAEWAQVHQDFYGTFKKTIEENLAQGKHLLFDIDVQGAKSLTQLYPRRVLTIFIHPPSIEELKKRLLERQGDSSSSIETRLNNAYTEIEWSKHFQHQIINIELHKAYQDLRKIILEECQ